MRKESKNVKYTVVKSVVGTLDLSIRYLLDGETFPGVQAFCLKTKYLLHLYMSGQFNGLAKLATELISITGAGKGSSLLQHQQNAVK